MSEEPKRAKEEELALAAQIGAKAARKLKARNSTQGVWFGLGMIGLVGWSVVVPTLLGAALGLWLDQHHPGKHAWTLALLVRRAEISSGTQTASLRRVRPRRCTSIAAGRSNNFKPL